MAGTVECIPNFSEGRDPGVIEQLEHALTATQGVVLLDRHLDEDHHRCVLTMAGTVESIEEAAFAVVAKAAELIDLKHHMGQHPRLGACDVLPFVPLSGSTMEQSIRLAHRVGAQIGEDLRIPVFLYEEACERSFRKRLEQIRKGGLESLKKRMATERAWAPDFGPAEPHPTAGVIAVGARYPLIAFNVVLQSHDVSLARDVARSIRASNGGLPAVKAIGLELKSQGCVQVSMNLVNYHQTPVHVAFEAVKRAAVLKGVAVVKSELVGLIPQEAFAQTEGHDLQVDALTQTQTLEHRLGQYGLGYG
ncbi:MAG: glutamate formimidoyltransferase [Nitrospira sp. SB0677_bin_15]|nr:glutamate formimidoyltransferase [Nitrospira sp. SB0667_bin_9]MYD30197.1 glutamate formimidoyltransferase [Nitrospira sp. SB0661_bin_20]MYG40432.1 glutamate formimidoyltransferase [Nitrospira sp. SB0677_bin_15]MYH02314.1 glutamate formimidoyltransferase [Nitrospira sp. SB0675_bin_23]MYJ21817.1 glutamate formimidoyltransferase [Nitrospira sp. SB0673_bin_12]